MSVFRWKVLSWPQSIQPIPVSGFQYQNKIGYTNQAAQKLSARCMANTDIIAKETHYLYSSYIKKIHAVAGSPKR
jgi:hypothetical protein